MKDIEEISEEEFCQLLNNTSYLCDNHFDGVMYRHEFTNEDFAFSGHNKKKYKINKGITNEPRNQ